MLPMCCAVFKKSNSPSRAKVPTYFGFLVLLSSSIQLKLCYLGLELFSRIQRIGILLSLFLG